MAKVTMEDLRYWPILNYLPASSYKNIRLVYVFGHAGSDVLLATHDDELLVFGFNSARCLGDSENLARYETESFNKIEALSKKRIKGFTFSADSYEHVLVLAYLENGEVYSWGHDRSDKGIFKPPALVDGLPKTVTEVACGIDHILALTSDGEVFAWGNNSKRQVTNQSQSVISEPVKIGGALSDKIVVKISCGFYFSVVLNADGVMYSWGENDKGQLGLNKVSEFEGAPSEVTVEDTRMKNIACGSNHVLALDTDGYLYSWGCNDHYQLGLHDIMQRSYPSGLTNIQGVRFKEVAASVDLSFAVGFDDFVEVWGKTVGECVSYSVTTPCRTIDEAFALFSCGSMYKPVEITSKNETVSEAISKLFGNQEGSDFKFIVEGKELFVHKIILKVRSQYFERMFGEHWLEASESSAEINENYEAMVAFLKYLYTDELEVNPRVALEVSVISDKYCESSLIDLCLQTFKKGLTDDNLAERYELTCEREMTNYSELCVDFAVCNMKGIFESEGFRKWKVDTYRSFFGNPKIIDACVK